MGIQVSAIQSKENNSAAAISGKSSASYSMAKTNPAQPQVVMRGLDNILAVMKAQIEFSQKQVLKKDNKTKHTMFKLSFNAPKKAKGGRRKTASFKNFNKYDKRSKKGTFLWGNNRDGLGDKQRRVLRGNPRPQVGLRGIKVALNASVPGFAFGKTNATSITYYGSEQQNEEQLKKQKKIWSSLKQSPLFICSYVDGFQTIIQLEDVNKKEVLSSCVIEHKNGKPGATCLSKVDDETVIGVFENHVFCLEIKNKEFKQLHFLPKVSVKLLDVQPLTKKISLVYFDNRIEVGLINKMGWISDSFFTSLNGEISSIEYKRPDYIVAGYINGQLVGYKLEDNLWEEDTEYQECKMPIKVMQACSRDSYLAVTGKPGKIVIYQPNKEKVAITLSSGSKQKSSFDKAIIYMQFNSRGDLIYAYNDGTIAKILNSNIKKLS